MNRREEEQLDAAIDIAARAMLDVEPASGLRARVLAQLAPPPDSGFPRVPRPRRRLWVWTVAPAAVAAMLMVMLWPRSVPEPMHHGSDYPLPIEKPAKAPRPPAQPVAEAQPHESRQPGRFGTVAPGFAPTLEDAPGVDPMAAPSPIVLTDIASGVSSVVSQIAVRPIEVPALEMNALPDAPDDRHEE